MQIALPYHSGDRDQAQRWCDWCAELGGINRHQLFIMPARGAAAIDPHAAAWNRVEFVQDGYGIVSNWNADDPIRDASGPNSMFRQLAWFFLGREKGPWMFCEPDAIPLRATWLDELEAAYVRAGKPYMGAIIPGVDKEYTTHATGNGIYPQDAAHNEGLMIAQYAKWGERTIEIAFDVAGAKAVLPRFASTPLIQQIFRGEPFRTTADLARIRPETALFHNDKTFSCLPFLRVKLGLTPALPEEAPVAAPESPAEVPVPSKPVVHTYCAWSSDPETLAEQEKVLSIWLKNWSDAGWDARVLTEDDARKHPRYAEFKAGFSKLPIKNPMEYEMACFMRWVAMAAVGGGMMVDYDILNNGYSPFPYMDSMGVTILCGHVPCAVIGNESDYNAAGHDFLIQKTKSDMHFFEKNPNSFERIDICREYGTPGWTDAKLIHFAHFACRPKLRSEVMQQFVEQKLVSPTLPGSQAYYDKALEQQLKQSIAVVYSVQDAVAALVEHSKRDGFAKGRVIQALRRAGFVPEKTKAKKK